MDLLNANDRQGEYPNSYYAASAKQLPPFESAQGSLECDICVIGGGFTGLSSALNLARTGYDVVLLDAQRIGFGASGRNGGQVGTGQRQDQDMLEDMLGFNKAKALWDMSLNAVQYVKELCDDPLVACQFNHGIVHADHKKRFVPHSTDYAKKLNNDYGYDQIRSLNQEEVRDLVNSRAYYGGVLDMGGGHIHPLQFAIGLARLAKAAGVRIFENSKVTEIDTTKPNLVKTEHANIKTDKVILACNGYLGKLNRKVAAKVMPINNFIVATEPLDPQQRGNLIKNNYAVADSKFVVNYFRFSQDHRLLFGGSESYGYRFPNDIKASVRKPMLKIYPQLKDIRLDYAWGGTLGITMNRMPHFADLGNNIISMSGYSGHGVAMATYAGRILSETLSGDRRQFELLRDIPTASFPGGIMLRSPLLVLAMLWYSLRDNI